MAYARISNQPRTFRRMLASAVLVALPTLAPLPALAQATPVEDKAAVVLNAGRLAYNDRNYPAAIERFRAFLRDFSSDKRAPAARYGLALALLDGPDKDFKAAAEALVPAINQIEPADRPYAQYFLGVAYRGLGNAELQKAAGKPNETQAQAGAANFFQQAAPQFAAAASSFAALLKAPIPPNAKELPAELVWSDRARCDQADMLLRAGRHKEAQAALDAWMKTPTFPLSRYRPEAIYLHGYAAFNQKDYIAAGRSLAQLAPFTDPVTGPHARYLLARTHHLADERTEAAANYEAVLTAYQQARKTAEEALKNPALLKDDPDRKAAFEALVRNPAPDYVGRALFYSGILLQQQNRPADALAKFTLFIQQNPKSPLVPEAQLRQGMAQFQARAFPAAIQILQPLVNHPQLGDQAMLWLARAQAASADPANPAAQQQALKSAAATLTQASEKARAMTSTDPDARARRAEIRLELADALQQLKQYPEAITHYQRVISENAAAPELLEPATQRLAVAFQLAGQHKESERICQQFLQQFPKSPLLPEVLFRNAENAFLLASALPAGAPNDAERKRLFTESIQRYQQVIAKAPDSAYVPLARQSMATAHYQLGQYTEAAAILKAIPEADRTGELANTSYLLADCLLRTLPADADDALATARLISQVEEVAAALNAFIGAQESSPFTPDAILKLGFCHQRIASTLADPVDKRKAIAKARLAYTTFVQKFAKHPLYPVAAFENAKCLAELGDLPSAIGELNRFQSEPLKSTSVAPLALIRLADYMRIQRRTQDAVNLLTQVKAQHEQAMLKDPARADAVASLHYNLGLALRDANKPAEARAIFENLAKQFPNRPEATEALWRAGQARKDEASARVDAARKTLASAAGKPDAQAPAKAALATALTSLREAAEYLKAQAAPLAQKPTAADVRAHMLYDAAWCYRTLADDEVDAAREKLQAQALQKLREKLSRDGAPAQAATLRPPDLKPSEVPLQPAEKTLRELYTAIIDAVPDAPIAHYARFELADHLASREEHDLAIRRLAEILEADPPHDLLERTRLRLGACYLAKNDPKNALAHFTAVQQNPRSMLMPHARFGAAECLILQQNWAGAIQQLTPFRDNEVLRSIPGASDRALLRLGQAHAQLNQWDPSRQALELLINRFPASPCILEARYGQAHALQMLKQYDQAVAAYIDLTNRTASELAAKAQLQVGLCRLEQKRYQDALNAFMVVPYTYDYPDLSASALVEASRALVELKKPTEATAALQRVLKENPTGRWAEIAQKRLAEIK